MVRIWCGQLGNTCPSVNRGVNAAFASALHSKLQGQTQFKLNEAENLSAMLGMTMSERDACFFDTQNRYERSLAAAERRKPK